MLLLKLRALAIFLHKASISLFSTSSAYQVTPETCSRRNKIIFISPPSQAKEGQQKSFLRISHPIKSMAYELFIGEKLSFAEVSKHFTRIFVIVLRNKFLPNIIIKLRPSDVMPYCLRPQSWLNPLRWQLCH